jgi:hypothetical protein
MKYLYLLFLTMCLVMFLGTTNQALAQDELVVEWDSGDGTPIENALTDAIFGDTTATGEHVSLSSIPGRYYTLKKNGIYWITSQISNSTFHLRIIGEIPGAGEYPPILQRVVPTGGTNAPGKLITGNGSLTLKNVYVLHNDDTGSMTSYQPIELAGTGQRYVFDNCIFERTNFASIAWTNADNDIFITNCIFRNCVGYPSTQQWEGRGISMWTDQDTVIVENNTFFNLQMVALQLEGGIANYLRFNHNTLVNIGRLIANAGPFFKTAYWANNLLVNVGWHGEGSSDLTNANRDQYNGQPIPAAGIFSIRDMPAKYGPDKGRRILYANNAIWRDPDFDAYYADSIAAQPFTDVISQKLWFDLDDDYPQIEANDTTWLATCPNFDMGYFEQAQIDSMIKNISDLRAGAATVTTYFWGVGPNTDIVWPLPEDFHYDDAALLTAGTDGLPLGDLNWFPTEKATFLANQENYVTQMQAEAGDIISIDPISIHEAEDGTLGGDAQIDPFTGDSWYTLAPGSNVEWTFNSTYAGAYDIKFEARADGVNIGFDFLVNGEHVVDALHGWGQFVVWTDGDNGGVDFWSNKSTTEFYVPSYANADLKNNDNAGNLSVVSGENTLKVQWSWNAISFKWIEFYEAGTTNLIARLIPADGVNSGSTPNGIGTWVPSGFNAVAMGSDGSVTLSVNAPTDGNYLVDLFYQNYSGASAGSVEIDGTEVVTLSFDSDADSTGLEIISSSFAVTAGTHDLTVNAGGLKLDQILWNRETVISGIEEASLPEGFALDQNYPNPFNPVTNIRFSLDKSRDVKLTVYNVLGQKVATLVDARMNAGPQLIQFKAGKLATGVYFYRLKADDIIVQRKMMLLK